ncbi:twin-arginine translocase TatA/TatE family subunit [Methylomonas subterranea]|uniref:twin-arginine translocase TatA/TatE family subunit n=1 Tax=Methylomonas subterranea TaxID=2952225 RepID=UPI003531D514
MNLGVTELLLILTMVIIIFGTKKLRGMGGDLGGAIRSFKQAMNEPALDEHAAQTGALKKPLAENAEHSS